MVADNQMILQEGRKDTHQDKTAYFIHNSDVSRPCLIIQAVGNRIIFTLKTTQTNMLKSK